jgi:hypothetical protein
LKRSAPSPPLILSFHRIWTINRWFEPPSVIVLLLVKDPKPLGDVLQVIGDQEPIKLRSGFPWLQDQRVLAWCEREAHGIRNA